MTFFYQNTETFGFNEYGNVSYQFSWTLTQMLLICYDHFQLKAIRSHYN